MLLPVCLLACMFLACSLHNCLQQIIFRACGCVQVRVHEVLAVCCLLLTSLHCSHVRRLFGEMGLKALRLVSVYAVRVHDCGTSVAVHMSDCTRVFGVCCWVFFTAKHVFASWVFVCRRFQCVPSHSLHVFTCWSLATERVTLCVICLDTLSRALF